MSYNDERAVEHLERDPAHDLVEELEQRIAELEAENRELGASISQAGYDSYEQSIRNRELRDRTEAAEKSARELSAENAGLRRQLYDANAELAALRAERWEPDTFDKVSAWIHESTEEARNE